MAVEKIEFEDKVSTIESSLPAINRIRDVDVNEIKDVVNNNADILEENTTIETGTGTIDDTYLNSIEYNHYEKLGHVVSYAFTGRANGTWSSTTKFITGLPKPVTDTRFVGLNASAGTLFRLVINTNGEICNAYTSTTPTTYQVIEGQLTYITSE